MPTSLINSEVMMKQFDKLVDKFVEVSKPVRDLAQALGTLAESVGTLSKNVAVLAHNQHVHHSMIIQMWNVQQIFFKKAADNALDMSLPDIDMSQSPTDENGSAPRPASVKGLKPKAN